MPKVKAGDINLNYVEHGKKGNTVIAYIHGNLGCVNWMDLVWPKLSKDFHIYAFDWRGCGLSDKPDPDEDYSNYSFEQHAKDMINALEELGVNKCHIANHSTGGIIATHMLLQQPEMFDKVLCLDPITPKGLVLDDNAMELFKQMKSNRDIAFAGLASAVPTLFIPETLQPGNMPEFNDNADKLQRDLFNLLVDKTQVLSDGIWFGTPVNLKKEFESGYLVSKAREIKNKHYIIWGERDLWISQKDVEEMAMLLPDAKLDIVEGVGHSMNVENPDKFVEIFIKYFL